MKYLLVIVVLGLSLTGCRSGAPFHVVVDVPVLGHLEAGTDPVKDVVKASDAIGLTTAPK